ncbi:MAG TPA: gluconeogenesis factor YvcK family protein [Chloroflexia bacterium]|nr:gluconeogenesis factor YvcK family protein [Chloroflexia bacterium]
MLQDNHSETGSRKHSRKDRPNIVVIGGGTGVSTVLSALKRVANVTAIVSMMDSGGSSGKLRSEQGVLPPGDILKCISELLPDDGRSTKWRDFLNYRFQKGEGLKGHSLGNLLLTAAYDWEGGTSFGIDALAWLLNLEGRVLPVTLNNVELVARLSDGREVFGETNIDLRTQDLDRKIEYITLSRRAQIFRPAADAIRSADKIVIGPGSLFTSILPNFLVEGVSDALAESRATKIYVCNLVTDPAETDGYKASDFIQKIAEYLDEKDMLDYAIVNTGPVSELARRMYETEHKYPVQSDIDTANKYVRNPVVTGSLCTGKAILRHNSQILAQTILELPCKS